MIAYFKNCFNTLRQIYHKFVKKSKNTQGRGRKWAVDKKSLFKLKKVFIKLKKTFDIHKAKCYYI